MTAISSEPRISSSRHRWNCVSQLVQYQTRLRQIDDTGKLAKSSFLRSQELRHGSTFDMSGGTRLAGACPLDGRVGLGAPKRERYAGSPDGDDGDDGDFDQSVFK